MKSEETTVTQDIFVWAYPKREYEDKSTGLFHFELSTYSSSHWNNSAICIYSQEVSVTAPGGIDLLGKAVETLEAAKVEAERNYKEKVLGLDKRISQLLLLDHHKEDVIEGEVV